MRVRRRRPVAVNPVDSGFPWIIAIVVIVAGWVILNSWVLTLAFWITIAWFVLRLRRWHRLTRGR